MTVIICAFSHEVCIARGTPKPKWDPTEERTASDGERKLDVQRMRRPTEQCLAEYVLSNSAIPHDRIEGA